MDDIKLKVFEIFEKANIALTDEEKGRLEIVDFGLNDLMQTGLEIITYINTERCCAKEMVLLPGQSCPEHLHPSANGKPGKEETFRCRWGRVYLYVDGEPEKNLQIQPPKSGKYTVFHEIVLNPGEQYTIFPSTKHWFKAGNEGAVISEFSTHSNDASDIFSDERIVR